MSARFAAVLIATLVGKVLLALGLKVSYKELVFQERDDDYTSVPSPRSYPENS